MSWFRGAIGNLAQSALGGQIMGALGPSVINGVLDQLNQNGMGAKVNSWLGQGENHPITAAEIRQALSNEKLQQMAQSLGIPADQVAHVLAEHLPAAVDQASPNGEVEPKAADAG